MHSVWTPPPDRMFAGLLSFLFLTFLNSSSASLPVVITTWEFNNATAKAWEVLSQGSGDAFDAIEQGKEASIKYYTDWISEVKIVVPKEKLLVFSVKEGWEPLCKFLDLPIPKESFPKTNDTKMMKRTIKTIRIASHCLVFGLVPVILGISKYILKYYLK